jgi:hypothetical protein
MGLEGIIPVETTIAGKLICSNEDRCVARCAKRLDRSPYLTTRTIEATTSSGGRCHPPPSVGHDHMKEVLM